MDRLEVRRTEDALLIAVEEEEEEEGRIEKGKGTWSNKEIEMN